MTHRFKIVMLVTALTAAVACHSSGGKPSGPIDAPFMPRYPTWVEIMENIMDPNYHDIIRVEAKKGEGSMNLPAIADAAEECADYIALGYGIHRHQEIDDFAEIAGLTEAWLREIAAAARRGEQAGLPQLIIEGEAKYCNRCHDAAG